MQGTTLSYKFSSRHFYSCSLDHNHNPTSRTASSSFHWTCISLF